MGRKWHGDVCHNNNVFTDGVGSGNGMELVVGRNALRYVRFVCREFSKDSRAATYLMEGKWRSAAGERLPGGRQSSFFLLHLLLF